MAAVRRRAPCKKRWPPQGVVWEVTLKREFEDFIQSGGKAF